MVACHYHGQMANDSLTEQLQTLIDRIDGMQDRIRRLTDENRSLRHQQEQLHVERSALMAKNEQARQRVEAMITRLKSLEQNT